MSDLFRFGGGGASMNVLNFTKHAQERSQQRAKNELIVDVVFQYGEEQFDRHGQQYFVMTSKATQQAQKDTARQIKELQRVQNALESKDPIFVVTSNSGHVITVGHQYRKRQRAR